MIKRRHLSLTSDLTCACTGSAPTHVCLHSLSPITVSIRTLVEELRSTANYKYLGLMRKCFWHADSQPHCCGQGVVVVKTYLLTS